MQSWDLYLCDAVLEAQLLPELIADCHQACSMSAAEEKDCCAKTRACLLAGRQSTVRAERDP